MALYIKTSRVSSQDQLKCNRYQYTNSWVQNWRLGQLKDAKFADMYGVTGKSVEVQWKKASKQFSRFKERIFLKKLILPGSWTEALGKPVF